MPSNVNLPEPIPKLGGPHSFAIVWRFNPEFYRLIGSRCKKCGHKYYPRRHVCPRCHSRQLEDVQLSHTGVIRNAMYAYQYGQATLGYEGMPPRVFGLIKLDDGPMLEGEITNLSPAFVKKDLLEETERVLRRLLIGKRVKAVLRRYRKLDNGNISYGLKWVTVDRIGWTATG